MEGIDSDAPVFDLNGLPDELHDKIIDSCDVRTMTALAGTSKHWYHKRSMCMYLRMVNILKHFQLDPTTFLKFLTRTGTVISGSAALLMFYPGLFTPGDLDIYCSLEMLDDVLNFIEAFTKYHSPEDTSPSEELARVVPYDVQYDAWVGANDYIARVLRLCCSPQPEYDCTEPTVLNIIAVKRIEPITAISFFHSTPVMNIITGKGVVCVYPELTLRMRGLINARRQSSRATEKFKECLDKYRDRGFQFAVSFRRWPRMRRDCTRLNVLKYMPLCAIAFPDLSDTAATRNVLKEAVLEEPLWYLPWELSEWNFEI